MNNTFLFVLVVLAVCPRSAWAYLDPGAGSAVLQGILAALVSAGVFLKMYWHQFLAFMRKPFRRPNDSDDDHPSSGSA